MPDMSRQVHGLRVVAVTKSIIENVIYCFIFSEVNTNQPVCVQTDISVHG